MLHKGTAPASPEHRAQAAAQLCWFGFQVEARKYFSLRRNPSHSHFKTKHSLVSRCRKSFCTEFWQLSKRNSQNFEHCLFFFAYSEQNSLTFYFQTALDRQTMHKSKPDNFSKNLASVLLQLDAEVPLTPLNFISLWGTHRGELKRGVIT